jgi:hypothetical protein
MKGNIGLHVRRAAAFAVVGAGLLLVQGCDKKYPYEEVLKRNSEAMNKKCPLIVDQATRLDSTSAGPGKRFSYYYTLTRQNMDSMDVKSVNANLRAMLTGNLRTNQSLELLRKNKTVVDYYFFDRKGRFILSIPVTPKDYGR